MEIRSAAVIGLGLMGGSVARELSVRGVRVLGHDADPLTRVAALRDGVVEVMLPPSLEGIDQAEVIILATPVRSAKEILRRLGPCRGTILVTDLVSTKASVLDAAGESGVADRFIGAHPMTGDHRSGWAASRLGLFQGALVYLCPMEVSEAAARRLAAAFWTDLGAHVHWIGADEHDHLLAASSHLPQVASSALARVLGGSGIAPADLGPGGRDLTRLADSSAELWTEILLDNREFAGLAVAGLERELAAVRALLEANDPAGLRDWLRGAAQWSAGCRENGENPVESVAAASHAG
jgi:prephenate dehydrogenase